MRSPYPSSIEPLEARIAPATVSMVLAGSTLKIDALSPSTNALVTIVQTGANSFDVADDFDAPVSFSGVKAIQMKLSDVADNVIINLSGSPYKGSVSIASGTGNDLVQFVGSGRVTGDVSVTALGASGVFVSPITQMPGALKYSSVGGFLQVDGQIGALTATGLATFSGGSLSALQSAKITGAATGATITNFGLVAENFTFTGGAGNDSFVHFGRINGKLSLNLGDGNNMVYSEASVGGSVSIKAGIGNDDITIRPGVSSPISTTIGIGGRIQLSLGDGNNEATIVGTGQIGGGVQYKGGAGTDVLEIVSNLLVAGNVTAAMGDGANTVSLGGAYVMGGVKVTGLAGTDGFTASGSQVHGKTTLSLGDGNNTASIGSGMLAGGLSYKGGAGTDNVGFGGVNVGGLLSVVAGEGNNSLTISGGEVLGGVKFKGGSGTDFISAFGSNIAGTFAVDAGDGSNTLETNVPLALARLTYKGGAVSDVVKLFSTSGLLAPMTAITVSLGDGADLLEVYAGSFRTLKADGGTGTDTLARQSSLPLADIGHNNFEVFTII